MAAGRVRSKLRKASGEVQIVTEGEALPCKSPESPLRRSLGLARVRGRYLKKFD